MRIAQRALLVALVALALAPAAGAAVHLRIDTSGFPLIRATLVAPLGAQAPTLREDGRPVVGYAAVNLGEQKALMLAIDRSQSMTGRPLAAAIAAAQSLVADAHASDDVGVVAFGRDAIALTPAAAPADASAALQGLSVDTVSGTALYDAVVLAANRLANDSRPGRAIVVVTDGQDVSSTHSLADAVAAARGARAAVYTIGIKGPGFTPDVLRRLARDTGGSYREAESIADLHGLYASLAGELDRTWQLSYVTSLRPGAVLHLAAAVPGAGTTSAQAQLAGDAAAADAPSSLIPAIGYTTGGTILVGLLAGFLVLLACLFWFASDKTSRLRARIEPHVSQSSGGRRASSRRDGTAARRKVADGLERALGDLRSFKGLQRKLERADLPLRAGEVVALCVALALVAGLVTASGGSSALITLCVMALAASLPVMYVSLRAGRRIQRFDEQLPDILITISASLKAGHSFRQGVQAVVEEGADPAAKEFRRVLTENQLGKPMEDALGDLALRVGSKNLAFVINAVTIQRQVGGSLAGLFDMVADTVRQRQQFRRKVKGLTAMGRMSAYVLVGLPVFIGLVVTAMNPTYMAPLYHSSTGQAMLTAGVVMIALGSLVLNKIVSFRG